MLRSSRLSHFLSFSFKKAKPGFVSQNLHSFRARFDEYVHADVDTSFTRTRAASALFVVVFCAKSFRRSRVVVVVVVVESTRGNQSAFLRAKRLVEC